jgi:hypothetical protein
MSERQLNERGSVMVLVLGIVAALTGLALIIVAIASSDKWTSFFEYTNSRAFYSADAASEAGINWIRMQPVSSPPPVLDGTGRVRVAGGFTPLSGDHNYKSDIKFVGKRFRPGWPPEYKDYEYDIEAAGASAKESEAAVDVRARCLFKEGY